MTIPDGLLGFLKDLTLGRAFLLIFVGVSAVSLYSFYEGRNAVFLTITGTPMAMLSTGIGVAIVAVAGIAFLFVMTLDKKTGQITEDLRERIEALEEHIVTQDKRYSELERRNEALVQQLIRASNDCDQRVREAIKDIRGGQYGTRTK